jgi:alpha-L-fucosidase 2
MLAVVTLVAASLPRAEGQTATSPSAEPVTTHRIVHRRPPVRWEQGLPLGNGDLGVMLWGDGGPLAFTLDKSDLWDLRANTEYLSQPECRYASLVRMVEQRRFAEVDEVFEKRQRRANPVGPTKISIGRAELNLGKPVRYECRLELATATVAGTIDTEAGRHELTAFVHRTRNVFCLRVTPAASAELRVIPLAEMNATLAKLNHPRPHLLAEGGVRVLRQGIPQGPAYAVAWNVAGDALFLAVESAATPDAAVAKARATRDRAAAEGFAALHAEHVAGWKRFWSGAAVYVPEQRIEFLWYYGLYLLSSSARRGQLPPGLQGLWPMDGVMPPWRGDYHGDMNVQETFWPAAPAGHLDLLDCWCDLMRDSIPAAQQFTRKFFGTEGTFWVCATLPRYTVVPGWHTVQYAWSSTGWLGSLVWIRWRYSMDRSWLAETGYPVMAEIFKFYRANLRREADGRLHIPVSSSPEYRENKPDAWCKDPNIDIALIRRTCDWLIEMEQALGQHALSDSAREVHDQLVPYHLTPRKELCLWADKPLDESHRHPSHLMAIHPAMDLTAEDPDARGTINASLEQFFALGRYRWAGHTYGQMASFGAVLGRGEFAYDCLLHLGEYWLAPNGLHFNRDFRITGMSMFRGTSLQFTLEANCGASAGLSDMLVQGWRNTLRVFPAVPQHWPSLAFRDLLAEGAFRVSAVRRDGRTTWVRIVAGVDRRLRLRNPFGEEAFEANGAVLHKQGGDLVSDLRQGQSVIIRLPGQPAAFSEAAQGVRQADTSRIGLH